MKKTQSLPKAVAKGIVKTTVNTPATRAVSVQKTKTVKATKNPPPKVP